MIFKEYTLTLINQSNFSSENSLFNINPPIFPNTINFINPFLIPNFNNSPFNQPMSPSRPFKSNRKNKCKIKKIKKITQSTKQPGQKSPQNPPISDNNPNSLTNPPKPSSNHPNLPINLSVIQKPFALRKSRIWTPEEDQRLMNAIDANGTENWPLVASLVGDRTISQCKQRWHRVLDPKISKANWSREEEQKLLNAVQKYGDKAWTTVASEMGNRSDTQCRFRYKFLLKRANDNKAALAPFSPPS